MSQMSSSRLRTTGDSSPRSFNQAPRSSLTTDPDLALPRLKYILWRIITLTLFATIYITVVAEGYRILIPTLARKIYTLPFLGFLRQFEDAHRIDIALIMAIALMFSVIFLWEKLLDRFVFNAHARLALTTQKVKDIDFAEHQVLFLIGLVILVCDLVLFYLGVASLSWGGGFSFTAVIASAAYVSVILTIAHVSNCLRRKAFPQE